MYIGFYRNNNIIDGLKSYFIIVFIWLPRNQQAKEVT